MNSATKSVIKNVAKLAAALAGLLVLTLVALMVSIFAGNKEMPDGQALPGGAVRVNDGYVSAYVLPLGEAGAALVDCGNDPEAKAIKAALHKRNLTPESVSAILLTHGHPDHIKGCKQFPKAQVYVGAGDEHLVDGTQGAKGPLPRLFGAQPALALTGAKVVQDGESLLLGGLLVKVFVIPGHTAGSAAYFAAGALYLGDSATITSSESLRPAPWLFSDDPAQNRASLKRLAGLVTTAEVLALVPAHSGSSASGGPLLDFARE